MNFSALPFHPRPWLSLAILIMGLSMSSRAQVITTIAGTGTNGYSGDGGLATNASFRSPFNLGTDAAGNLYIADYGNNRIRKINASDGTITTIAGNGTQGFSGDGGLATSASLHSPRDVTFDAAGNLYIAEEGNHRIRKVNAGNGIISTVAGTGTAGFSGDGGLATSASLHSPTSVAIDGAGNLFIVDAYTNHIRKVNATTGIISTVAGTGTAGYNGDGGLATSASLNIPLNVVIDAVGNLLISDSYNHRIRKINASNGIITTITGNGIGGFSGDGGAATSASLNFPDGLAVDAAGNIFVSESGNDRIRKITVSNGTISTVAGNGTQGFSGDGGLASSASLRDPRDVAVDGAGNLFVMDWGNNRIRKVSVPVIVAPTIITTIAGNGGYVYSGDGGPATNASFSNLASVAIDAAKNLYIVENQRIRKINASDGIINTVAGTGTAGYNGDGGPATGANLDGPTDVAVDAAGNLYIPELSNRRIRKVNVSDGIISTVAGNGGYGYSGDGGPATSASLISPQGVAVDRAGNIFIADSYGYRIRKVSAADGTISTVAGNGAYGYSGDGGLATSAGLDGPGKLAFDSAGNLYLTDGQRIRKINVSNGIIATVAGTGVYGYSGDGGPATSANLGSPSALAFDGANNLYFSDFANHRIRRINASDGKINTVAGTGIQGFSGDGGPATSASLNYPIGVALDGAGNLYIGDYNNNRIRKVGSNAVLPVSITVGTIPAICSGATSFLILFTTTTGSPDQYTVTGTGVNPGQTGALAGPSGSLSVNIDPATFTGSFTLVVRNTTSGASSSPLTTTVPINTLPTAFTLTGGGGICTGGDGVAIGLSSSQSGVTYQLYRGDLVLGSPVPGDGSPISFGYHTSPGTYTVRATQLGSGCSNTMTGNTLVTVYPAASTPTISASGPTTICAGSQVGLTASAGSSYRWSTGDVSPSITVGISGPYSVTVTDGNGCSASATAQVMVSPLPNADFSGLAGPYCADAIPVSLTPTTAGGSFVGPGVSGSQFSPASAGVGGPYSLSYTVSQLGCTNTTSQSVSVLAKPAAPSLLTQSGQLYAGGQISVSVAQYSGPVTLVALGCGGSLNWNGPASSTDLGTAIEVSTLVTGTFIVSASCLAGGCTSLPASATVVVQTGPLLMLAPRYDCATGQLSLRTSGGNGHSLEFKISSVTNSWSSQSTYVLDAKQLQKGKALKLEVRQIQADGRGWDQAEQSFTPTNCDPMARQGAPESIDPFQVKLLGNPLVSSQIEVEVSGAAGQAVQFDVVDLRGWVILQQLIEAARAVEIQRLEIGAQPAGLLLLRVSTPTQQRMVKVVKP